jgi:hypothetical protein
VVGKLYDVDFAKDVRDSIAANPTLADKSVMDKLKSIPDYDFVLVTKVFNSPKLKIIDVDKVDSDFVSIHVKYR